MKRFIAILTTLCILFTFPLLSASGAVVKGEHDFLSERGVLNNPFSDFDYYLVVCYTSSTGYYFANIYINDYSDDTMTITDPKGKLYFYTGDDPADCLLKIGTYNTAIAVTPNTNYAVSAYRYTSGKWASQNAEYWLSNMVFDNLYPDAFPLHNTSLRTHYIVASNVDIYSYSGELLQEGNYDELLSLHSNEDLSYIVDYTGSNDVEEETTEPTTRDYDSEQVEVSSNILENVKNIVSSIVNLPSKIADAIGGFFTSLGDKILDGLEFLFAPSDNLFVDLINLLKEKFGFIFQILEIGDFLLNSDFEETPPDITVNLSPIWGNNEKVSVFDYDSIEPYRDIIRGLILAVSTYFFIRKVRKRLPDIINGTSEGGSTA